MERKWSSDNGGAQVEIINMETFFFKLTKQICIHPLVSYKFRPGTEDIIHYFTLMSSELHYLDIILKMEKFTLMSSEFGENCLYFCDFACIFVILPVYL